MDFDYRLNEHERIVGCQYYDIRDFLIDDKYD